MQDHATTGAAQNGTAQEDLDTQGGRLTVHLPAQGALEFTQQVEQQQHGAESSFGGKELLQAEVVSGQIIFQFGDPLLHIRAVGCMSREPGARISNPIMVTRDTTAPTSRQIWAYLLCSECEQHFNARAKPMC